MSGGKLTFLHDPNETQDQPRLWEVQVAAGSISALATTPAGGADLTQLGCVPLTRMYVGRAARAADLPKHSLGKLLAAMPRFVGRAATAKTMSASDCAQVLPGAMLNRESCR